MFNEVDQWKFSNEFFCSIRHQFSNQITFTDKNYKELLDCLWALLKLLSSSYVVRKTQYFSITANFIVLYLLWVVEECHVDLFNACTVSVYYIRIPSVRRQANQTYFICVCTQASIAEKSFSFYRKSNFS